MEQDDKIRIVFGTAVVVVLLLAVLPSLFDVGLPSADKHTITGYVQDISYDNGSGFWTGYHEQAWITVNNVSYYADGWMSLGNGDNTEYIGEQAWQNVTNSHVGSYVEITYSMQRGFGEVIWTYSLLA